MYDFFDIDTIFFTIWGYPMSYLEFFGVLCGAAATWLLARNNVWTWPLALVGVVLSFFLFYQIQLYPDMLLQGFFFVTYSIGWWRWVHPAPDETDRRLRLRITRLSAGQAGRWLVAVLVATLGLGAFASHLHGWFPVVFRQPSAFPYLDSFTSVLSIWGTYLTVQKKLESWYVWLLIDLILTYIYFVKGVRFVATEYLVFCFIALYGAWHWTKTYRTARETVPVPTV